MMPAKTAKRTLICPSCGSRTKTDKMLIKEKIERKKVKKYAKEIPDTMPKTNVECSKCGNKEAYWWTEQTRAADEPETQFFRCTKCRYTWREYI